MTILTRAALVACLGDPGFVAREWATDRLRLDPGSIEAVRAGLGSDDAEIRARAWVILRARGHDVPPCPDCWTTLEPF